MNAVRTECSAVDPDQPVFTAQTVEQMLAQQTWPYRVFGTLFAIFAVIALVMSAVGLYAVMAYSVTQRTTEIGVRMALGADGRQVSWLILKRGLWQMGARPALGLAGAFGLSRVAAHAARAGHADRSADVRDDHGDPDDRRGRRLPDPRPPRHPRRPPRRPPGRLTRGTGVGPGSDLFFYDLYA